MRRLLLVASLACVFIIAGFVMIGLAMLPLLAIGGGVLPNHFLAVGLALLLVLAPFAAGHLIPSSTAGVRITGGYCPCCGSPIGTVAKPDNRGLADF